MSPKRYCLLQEPTESPQPRTVLHGVSLPKRMFQRIVTQVDFVDCEFNGTEFTGSELTSVTFTNCDLRWLHLGQTNLSGVTFTNCSVGLVELYAAFLDRVSASPEFWAQAQPHGAYLSRGETPPWGYTLCTPTQELLDLPKKWRWTSSNKDNASSLSNGVLTADAPKDSQRGRLTYDLLEYDAEELGPRAQLLLKEHPRLPTKKLRALSRALSAA